jgi:hypothetical protein
MLYVVRPPLEPLQLKNGVVRDYLKSSELEIEF